MSRPNRMFAAHHGAIDVDKGLDRAVLARAWRFAAHYRKLLLLNILTIFVSSGVGVLPPLVFRELIDTAIPDKNLTTINLLFIAAIALAFAATGLGLLTRWFSSTIGEGLICDLRVALYNHVQRMPIGFFTRTQTGSLLSRLNSDVVGAQATVTTATTVISDLLTLTTTLIAMFALSWRVTLISLIVLPLFVVLDRKLGRRLVALSRLRMQANAEMTTTVQERFNVSGAMLIKLFGRPRQESNRFAARANDVRRYGIRSSLTSRTYYGALALAGSIGTAFVYWLGARAVVDGAMTIGTLTALAAYVARLYDPLTSIASARVDLLTALVSFERCFEVLDAPVAIKDAPDATTLERPTGLVELDHVWFRYPAPSAMSVASLEVANANAQHDDEPSDWVLKDVSLRAEPGQTIALVGRSGAGKTTLSSLLLRLYDVDKGAIRIDGHDVRKLTMQSVADAFGVVSQDTHLFHDTIASNLRYAKETATDEEIESACRSARIHDVIDALPDGYNTVVGERGYRLSGGEKQRLALARVLLKQPAIVMLDEATAHLDSETEALVQEALGAALAGRTAIVIAHRLSTIRSADQILVLADGQILEQGTHAELLAHDGLYSDLHATQFAQQQPG